MTVYMDENIPPHLAKGFQLLQLPDNVRYQREIEVKYLPEVFERGVKDLDWRPALANQRAYVITRDIHITRRKDELEAYRKSGIGLFLIRGKNSKDNPTVWEMVEMLAKHWQAMVVTMLEEEGPFAYKLQLNKPLTRWPK